MKERKMILKRDLKYEEKKEWRRKRMRIGKKGSKI